MSTPVEVTDANFTDEVANADTPVLLDFWAQWCPGCRVISPILDEIAEEQTGALKIAKVNADEYPQIASQFGIHSLPTMILYKNGQAVERMIGAQPKARILQTIEPHFN